MLLPGPLKNIMRGRGSTPPTGPPAPNGPTRTVLPPRNGMGNETFANRQSRGLHEFFTYIRDQSGLTILDLGGATQQNVNFITNLGHRLYSEDFLQILNDTFGVAGTVDQSNPGRIEYFLKQTLDYSDAQFDGVLVWDALEYLNP